MGRSISQLPLVQTASASDLVAIWAARNGADSRVPAAGLPLSTAAQQAIDALRSEMLVGTGTYLRAMDYIDDSEKLEVRNPAGTGGRDLAGKIQAALDAAYLLTGTDQDGAGGHGVCMDFDPGTWTFSTLQLKPGMALRGLVDRFEVRFKQTGSSQAPLIDILGRGQNQDVSGRRTAVVLERIDFNCNGNLDANGDPINGINLRVDPDNEGDDDSANRTGVIAREIQVGGASGWGLYNLKRGKVWLSMCQFAGNGLAPLLPNNKVGGLFSQGPDSFFYKVYCGNNGGPQLHIKSSATPTVLNVELGVSKQANLYPSFYSENNTDLMFGGGGNCTGWILIEGEEDDNTANEYDTECNINLHNFSMTFKDKTFKDEDGVAQILPGYVHLKNIRGVSIDNVRFKPATDDDIAVHHYTYRPTQIVYIQGARTRATLRGPLPPLADWRWPAGAPEAWPGAPPTNDYSSITNKKDQLTIQSSDPTDATHAHLLDRIKGLFNSLEIASGVKQTSAGVWDLTGGTILRPTSITTAVDITAGRNDLTASADTTLTFSGSPSNGTMTSLTIKATGADRVITLPASVVDMQTGNTVSSFTVKTNKSHVIGLMYMFGEWKVWGYPTRALIDKNYADDAAAAAGGVAVGEEYHNAGAMRVRLV